MMIFGLERQKVECSPESECDLREGMKLGCDESRENVS